MNGDIRDVARLGLVHHLLFPDCGEHPEHHVETLTALASRSDIETLDCCLPFSEPHRQNAITALRKCPMDKVFAIHFFPLRQFSLASISHIEQGICKAILKQMIGAASEIGASGFIFASGIPPAGVARSASAQSFAEMIKWLAQELQPHGITALLEPFDTDVDKCFLYGSSKDCAELINDVASVRSNVGIELDIAHVPLMGETITNAIQAVATHLKRVHLGNCVLKDPTHPRYGDTHPPIGLPGGEIDVPQLTETFRALLDIGYLRTDNRGALVMEMTPFPNKTPEYTVETTLQRIDTAWAAV